MITLRRSEDRGHTAMGWLNSRHSFSFGKYNDAKWAGFRALRVLNEDMVAPDSGFDEHGHKDMEIFTYVLSGALTHTDSLGTEDTIKAGSAQIMSAGTGIRHAEYNKSNKTPCHLLQIWIEPNKKGLKPRHDSITLSAAKKNNALQLLASPKKGDDALLIHQDAYIYATRVSAERQFSIGIEKGRHVWVQVVEGRCSINGEDVEEGDAVALSDEKQLDVMTSDDYADLLLIDMA